MKNKISNLGFKALSIQVVLALLISLFVLPLSAEKQSSKTDFMSGKYGIFLHYLSNGVNSDEDWQTNVKSCNTEKIATAAENAGASWVTLTLTQSDGRYCIPIGTIFKDSNIAGFTGNRSAVGVEESDDLVNRLYTALDAKGIKLMLYWIPGAPANNDAMASAIGATEKIGNDWKLNETVITNVSAAMKKVSDYYGNKISGWWIDGCYDSIGFTNDVAVKYSSSLKSGNSQAVVAFNNGTKYDDCRFESEDYSAGEICHPNTISTNNIYNYSANGRWTENGFQKHYLTFLGTNWGTAGTYYNTEKLVKHCYENVLNRGAAMTFDVYCSANGTIDAAQLTQLEALKAVCASSNSMLPFDFEDGKTDNFDISRITDSVSVESSELVSGSEALNGNYSLKITARDETRIQISSRKSVDGVSDFSYEKLIAGKSISKEGFMLRMKMNGDGTKMLPLSLLLTQSGKVNTWLGSKNVKAYDIEGNEIVVAYSNFGCSIPSNFNGFIFIPFTSLMTDGSGWPRYDAESADTNTFVNLAEPFSFNIALPTVYDSVSWNGITVLIDDISYYSGDHYDFIRSLGYEMNHANQPDIYELPLNFENYELPSGWNSATQIYQKNDGSWPSMQVSGIASLAKGNKALENNISLKFSVRNSIQDENSQLQATETGFATVKGISGLDKETLISKSTSNSTNYAYLSMRIRASENNSEEDYPFRLCFKQGSVNGASISSGTVAYDIDGKLVSVNSDLASIYIPSGFDGWLYIPIVNAINISNDWKGYNTGSDKLPDFSQDFELGFRFEGMYWADNEIFIDDLGVVLESNCLPLNFETPMQRNISSNNGEVSYVTAGDALNGSNSMKIRFGNQFVETNGITVGGNNSFSWTDIQGSKAKYDGIMLRVKVSDATADALLPLTLVLNQSEKKKTWLGRNGVVLYDVNGNVSNPNANNFCTFLPGNFDGFVFIPFTSARLDDATWTEYSETGDMSKFVDLSNDYSLSLVFRGVYEGADGSSWYNSTAIIDDICYYTGNHYDFIRSLGYEMLNGEQPDAYSFPLDFESYDLPFSKMYSWYENNGTYGRVAGNNYLIGKKGALSGTVSLGLNVPVIGNNEFIRSESAWSKFNGESGLDKETMMCANNDYAKLRFRLSVPSDENETYTMYFSVTQSSESAGSSNIGYLGSTACGYNLDGSYNSLVTSSGYNIQIPAGFNGYIDVPIYSMIADVGGKYISYKDSGNELPDLSKPFEMRVNTYGANTEGKTFIIDDMSMEIGNLVGDINKDGKVNSVDISMLRTALLTGNTTEIMDVNGDKYVDIRDLVKLKKICVIKG